MKFALAAIAGISIVGAQMPSPPGGTSSSVTYNATYKLDGGAASQSNQTYLATAADTSGVWVTDSGVLTLTNPTIKTSGNTSSQDNSSFYGQNAALLATSGGRASVTGGAIATTGSGANGAFATGSGSSVSLAGVTINATGAGAHAVMATQGASLSLADATLTTTGASASAIATDRGGGTISVAGGNVLVSGMNSAGIYSTGVISVAGTTFKSTGAEGAVIEGANTISLAGVGMTVTMPKWGVMIYQSMSGDASGTRGIFTMAGGSLTYTPASGPLFYVTNSTGVINLAGAALTTNSGVFLQSAAGSWGSAGSNGGIAVVTADGQALTGDLVIDSSSTSSLTLKNSSSLKGAINTARTAKAADLTLDSTSKWSLTADSYVSALSDRASVSGGSAVNITGNGHNVYYDGSLSANSYLGGKVYALLDGGSLMPAGSTVTSLPAIAAGGVVNAASFVAGVAPGAWISIFGSNLATSSAAVTAADLAAGYLPTTFAGATVTVDGKPAYISYASPTQINVEAPADSAAGNVTVTVTTAAGSSSLAATMEPVMPGLFTRSNYVLAVRPSDSAIIDGTGAAARPGDILELYATGLGNTSPTVPPGLVFSGSDPTTSLPSATIGGSTAAVSYCGLVGAGLYQINVAVPGSLTAGTYPVVLTLNGVQSPASAVLKVAEN